MPLPSGAWTSPANTVKLVGEALGELAIEVEDFAGGSKRNHGDPAEDHVDRVPARGIRTK